MSALRIVHAAIDTSDSPDLELFFKKNGVSLYTLSGLQPIAITSSTSPDARLLAKIEAYVKRLHTKWHEPVLLIGVEPCTPDQSHLLVGVWQLCLDGTLEKHCYFKSTPKNLAFELLLGEVKNILEQEASRERRKAVACA